MKHWSRRNLLKTAGSLALASALPSPNVSVAGMWTSIFGGFGRKVSPITPNDDFFITSYRSPPNVRVSNWTLAIKGLVKSPMILTYSELLALPTVTEIVTLECVGNGVGGESIGTANWEGVPLKSLLDRAGVDTQAYDVVLRAADGYSDSFTVERAMQGDVLVAHKMNGETLPPGHGYPARIIVPGIYGMKNVQWLTEIELVSKDYQGYFQRQGWSDDATVQTRSWITDPQEG
ncbi:MAG: molybdopterin-dependent oxidoreductase, partial [Nitrospirota bacterium]|nr:molybdopterin-dependent oxidoreductase [Nitrospirota bacterium]